MSKRFLYRATKRAFVVLLILSVITGLFLFAYEKKSKQKQSASFYSLTKEELSLLKDGDIILRHGYGMVSDMIGKSMRDPRKVSHCAILCRDTCGKISVIHSVSQSLSDYDGVQKQGLRRFILDSKPGSVVVLRYKMDNDPKKRKLINYYANSYYNQQIAFDHSFKLSNTSAFYCTELIWRVFLDVYDDDIFISGSQTYDPLKFTAFWDTTRFEIVFDHHRIAN